MPDQNGDWQSDKISHTKSTTAIDLTHRSFPATNNNNNNKNNKLGESEGKTRLFFSLQLSILFLKLVCFVI